MRPLTPAGIGARIALAALAVSLIAVTIVGLGTWFVGGQTFEVLMAQHGQSAEDAHEMFDAAVTRVLLLAVAAALIAAVVLAGLLGSRLGRPLREVRRAARSIAAGNFRARVPRQGSPELVDMADSFNDMAASLEQQERQRREFIANAAHELRTPLTNLQGYLEALRDSVIEPDRQTFESLWEEADRLVRLSRSLDQLAVGDANGADARRTELDVALQVRAAVDLYRPAAQSRDLRISTDGPESLTVLADPDWLAQVLANLLNNAVAYTPDGGAISASWQERPDDVLIALSNTGEGIPAADIAHVFERFYRVEKSRDRQRGGAGIGLAIVRQLVESLGGRVGAESRDGLTRFWFTLPRPRGA